MKKVFFTSDLHFDHTNIVRYCSRPFDNVEKMNSTLVENWNRTVDHESTVYVVGDFSLSSDQSRIVYFLSSLHGTKHLIVGNHDSEESKTSSLWKSVNDLLTINVNGQLIVLCHYSMRVWNRSHHGSWMLYGHSHGSLVEEDKFSFDVGVDVWNYTPVSYEQIVKKMQHKQKNFMQEKTSTDKQVTCNRNASQNEMFFKGKKNERVQRNPTR
jgi:calcineurin-like phosphoesterase family protein